MAKTAAEAMRALQALPVYDCDAGRGYNPAKPETLKPQSLAPNSLSLQQDDTLPCERKEVWWDGVGVHTSALLGHGNYGSVFKV